MIKIHDVTQGTVKWKLIRQGLWTGSSAMRLLTGKPYREDSDWDGNDATRRGHALETIAIREYERKFGRKVKRPGFITNTVYPNAGYSPDGIDGKWLLEVKCFNKTGHQQLVDRDIPLPILCQIYFGMIVTGKRKAKLLAFHPDFREQLTVINLTYDKKIGDNIRKKLREDMKKRRSIENGA